MAVENVIYVSTAQGTGSSDLSRTTAIWEPGRFSDDNITVQAAMVAFSLKKMLKYR